MRVTYNSKKQILEFLIPYLEEKQDDLFGTLESLTDYYSETSKNMGMLQASIEFLKTLKDEE